ncbi:CD209 antigen-like protein [Labeo rohita]|nr:CD209 antigen-like protein [Labeo rohita]
MTEKDQLQGRFNDLSNELKAYKKRFQWFFVSDFSKSWSESRQYCKDRGADLVIINTEEKQRFITSIISGNEKVWIGLSDTYQEGNMEWVDGSPLKQGDTECRTLPQTPSQSQDAGKAKKCRGCGCLVSMAIAMCFTLLICAVLVVFIILQHTSITAERESQSKNYKEAVQVFNQTNSMLQGTNSHLMTENNQLQERFSNLSDELYKAVQVFNQTNSILQGTNSHLMTENTQLQEKFNDLSDELKKAYQKGWFSGQFFLSNVSKSWSESRQYCKDQGGDLVIIKTEIKQNYLTSYISDNERVWIGLTDTRQEGKMEWVDNSPLKQG